jgi:hypothetical protein
MHPIHLITETQLKKNYSKTFGHLNVRSLINLFFTEKISVKKPAYTFITVPLA